MDAFDQTVIGLFYILFGLLFICVAGIMEWLWNLYQETEKVLKRERKRLTNSR